MDSVLTVINHATTIGIAALLIIVCRHAYFFYRAKSDELGKRTMMIFIAEVVAALSILFFSASMLFLTPDGYWQQDYYRFFTKLFQCLSVYFTLWASYRFGEYIKGIK